MLVQSILCDRQVLGTIQFPKYIQLNWYFILGAVRPTSPPAATSERTGFLQVPCLICEPCNTQWCLQSCPMPNLRQLKQTCVVKNIFYHEKQKTQKFKTKSSMAEVKLPLHRHPVTPEIPGYPTYWGYLSFLSHVLCTSPIPMDVTSTLARPRWHLCLHNWITPTKEQSP